jgi:fructose-1,6-bisphosphatase/inositol monophosphatase family enzyme
MLLGVLRDGFLQAGLIRMPALGEVFAGARGLGATMNGLPISCRALPSLDEARIFINEANLLLVREPSAWPA